MWKLFDVYDAGDGDRLLDIALTDVERRLVALGYLGELADPETVPGILRLLGASDPVARAAAAAAVGAIGSRRATAPLIEHLADEANPVVRGELVQALGRIGDASAAPAVRDVLRRHDDPAFEAAAVASARLRDRDALPLLRSSLEGRRRRDRRLLERAVESIEAQDGWPAPPPSLARRALSFAVRIVGHERWWVRALVGGGVGFAIAAVARPLLPTWAWVSLLVAWLVFAFVAGGWERMKRLEQPSRRGTRA